MVSAFLVNAQDNVTALDQDFLNSLPESVRNDILSEMKETNENDNRNIKKRPSTELLKLETVRDWENFKKQKNQQNLSERYGLRLFKTMQSSFMPLNEPNFGNNYILDYGDVLSIKLIGNIKTKNSYIQEIQRDGSILLEEIGSVVLAGLNFEEAKQLIKSKYNEAFIGVDTIVTLDEIRDVNVLITGNVEFPGIYTLSGNSNLLQAINVAGGITENGSLREITIKRSQGDINIDLYEALIFGDIKNIPFLTSGDSINVAPVKNLVRAGYGLNNIAVYELLDNETLQDLVNFSGGLNAQAKSNQLNLVRFDQNDKFVSYQLKESDLANYTIQNLDSLYAYQKKIGTITLSGEVKNPGKYSISSNDTLFDVITRAGGYTDSAYKFGGSLFRESVKEIENQYALKTYGDLIKFITSNPAALTSVSSGSGGQGLSFILSELKEFESMGRVVAEFDDEILTQDKYKNITLEDADVINIPPYSSNVLVLGEIGNPGSVMFDEKFTVANYVDKSGGMTRFSSKSYAFVVYPNGETEKIKISRYLGNDTNVYPGSVIYIPRDVGKVEGLNLLSTIAPIFSSLAISAASLNSIKD